MATEQTWEEILRTNRADLLVLIDTESGLEEEVKRLGLATGAEHMRIWEAKDDTIERNKRLLDFISRGDFERFKTFCEALVNSGQKPIVTGHLSEIKKDWTSCVSSDDPRSSRPIKESHRDCLRQNWNYLLENIDNCKEIEAELRRRSSLTTFQLTRLQNFKEDVDKTRFLLTILEKGSEKLFDDFCEILKTLNKQHLVVTLTPSEAQLALDDIKTNFRDVELGSASDSERERKLSEIKSGLAYAVSNGVVNGRVLIFSNRYFAYHKPRNGTEYDEANLKDFFQGKLKFQTNFYTDLTSQEMRQTLENEASQDMEDVDVFILFFMSHGINGQIYGMDSKTIKTNDIVNLLDGNCCPQLAGKPKLIFIQADRIVPRGKKQTSAKLDGGAPVQEMTSLTLDETDPEVEANLEQMSDDDENDAIPSVPYHAKADMAVFYATVRGDYTYRREYDGSFFIRLLLDVFTKKAHKEDVESMVTEAFRLVHELQNLRQLGEKRSSLLRKVYFVI